MNGALPRALPAALAAQARALERSFTPLSHWFGGDPDTQLQLLVCGLLGLRVLHAGGSAFDRAAARALVRPEAGELDGFLCELLAATQPLALIDGLDAVIARLAEPAVATWLAHTQQPLVDFYEPFLRSWHSEQRRVHGVYFTPQELAQHVVGRVDGVLRDELGVPRGLADDRSFAELGQPGSAPGAFAVRVLDPAAGTGAFLSQVIVRVHHTLQAEQRARGLGPEQRAEAWQRYVPERLLPRLLGFEILPVAAALCELQLQLTLVATGYRHSGAEPRIVCCADALQALLAHLQDSTEHAAHQLEHARPISVVIGNPPYRRGARGRDPAWERLLHSYKAPLQGEKNLQPLADDYVRFMRASELLLQRAPFGVAGLVTNGTYLDGHLHRGLRASLLQSFARIDVLDLGGATKHAARSHGAARDENVFGVATGVAVAVLRRGTMSSGSRLRHAALRGRRLDKLAALLDGAGPAWSVVAPSSPTFLFVAQPRVPAEYATYQPLDQLFDRHSIGAKPGDDAGLVGFDEADARAGFERWRALAFAEPKLAGTEALRKLRACAPPPQPVPTRAYAYRPFDTRSACDLPQVWARPVHALRSQLRGQARLLATRLAGDGEFAHVFATRCLPDVIFLSNKSSVNCYAFDQDALRLEAWSKHAPWPGTQEQAFAYVYAVLHSRAYRSRYAVALARGFARLPLLGSTPLASALVELGERLLRVHLMEDALADAPRPRFVGGEQRHVEPRFAARRELTADARGCVTVQLNRSARFEDVPLACWSFRIGGYQVCHKWLLDRMRAGRALSDQDVEHYRSIVASLSRTLELMDAIDVAIDAHGGWPEAFAR